MYSFFMLGKVMKLVDASQFQHAVHIGQVTEVRGQFARLHKWPLWVPIGQLVPLKGDVS